MIVIDRKAPWKVEPAWLVAVLAELGHERAAIIIIAREYLRPMIHRIGDEQETSMVVEHQASRAEELAISMAVVLGADRELDSSITIKSIVSHLFLFNLSLSQRQRDDPSSKLLKPQRDDEDMKLSLTRDTRHERDTKQASNEATRSNKNQSMKEQRTAPPSTNHSLTHTSLFLIFIIILESSSIGIGLGIGIGKRS